LGTVLHPDASRQEETALPLGASSQATKERFVRWTQVIGLLAVASSALYFASDVIEVADGGFSTGQLWLTLVAEATLPIFVIGLWLAQRPRIGRLGAVSAIAYAYGFVFFTGTVVYALVQGTRNFDQLGAALDPAMTIHGGVMVVAGIAFGYAVVRAGVLPRWTGIALAIGVVLLPVSMGLADIVGLVGVGLRDLGFAGMGAAILHSRPAFDPLVLGSAVYAGSWMREAVDFAERNADVFSSAPVWLFSSGPLGTKVKDEEEQPRQLGELNRRLKPQDHRVFSAFS